MDKFYRLLIGITFTFLLFSILVRAVHGSEVRFKEYTIQGNLEEKDVIAVTMLDEYSTLNISSLGGDQVKTNRILEQVHDKKLNTVCLNVCASAAAVIYQAGHRHDGQPEGATLIFHAPGIDLPDGSRQLAPNVSYWKKVYGFLGIDKLLTKSQWDIMWERPEVVIEIDIKG